ncbi:BZ3500_MvSof-1268-A1-R1_Chr1-1g00903 [Microbotryum saponariae]|uniref:Queuosine 5'-phosphate N-glycosylase/hydrolase n=1 Tax=Microbotryum saponariae TaxID=289078 RepID=A0A2X0K9Z6_9BASI|nr:BZ3500_MvSof-1268-A1-R1_Chr1-1g00903 [Microbotryum saponariae]SCZ92899.1 BZ3501_MvSof-1269-A2-R1_Chr1-1g00500 [Microbotryum saponariae]
MAPSLPPRSESILDSIRSSCRALTARSDITVALLSLSSLSRLRTQLITPRIPQIDDEAIDTFLHGIGAGSQHLQNNHRGLRLPLRFDSAHEELNLIAVLSLLNFLSGYRKPLHRLTQRGAFSNILSLVLAAHLSAGDSSSSSLLSAKGMRNATLTQISSMAQIQTHQEKPHPTLGPVVKVGMKDDDAFEILELIVRVLNRTGEVLKKEGKEDLGHWVQQALLEVEGDSEQMLRKIYDTFPDFQDAYTIDGGCGFRFLVHLKSFAGETLTPFRPLTPAAVYILKKALYLLNAITLRFSASGSPDHAPTFPLPTNTTRFPIFADNVIPSVLMHHRIIVLSTSRTLRNPPLLSTEEATRLRAASISACHRIVERAQVLSENGSENEWMRGMLEVDLDGYLWDSGKRESGKNVVRIAERGTTMY